MAKYFQPGRKTRLFFCAHHLPCEDGQRATQDASSHAFSIGNEITSLIDVVSVASITNPYAGLSGDRLPEGDNQAPGILGLTRHPAPWALILWGAAHVIANGDLAGVLFLAHSWCLPLSRRRWWTAAGGGSAAKAPGYASPQRLRPSSQRSERLSVLVPSWNSASPSLRPCRLSSSSCVRVTSPAQKSTSVLVSRSTSLC